MADYESYIKFFKCDRKVLPTRKQECENIQRLLSQVVKRCGSDRAVQVLPPVDYKTDTNCQNVIRILGERLWYLEIEQHYR